MLEQEKQEQLKQQKAVAAQQGGSSQDSEELRISDNDFEQMKPMCFLLEQVLQQQ